MTKEELGTFYDKLAELTEHGTEGEVRAYISGHLSRLPENVRNEILFNTLFTAVQTEAEQGSAVAGVLEEGLDMIDALEQAKTKIEQEGLTE